MNLFYEMPSYLICGVCGKVPHIFRAYKDGKETNVCTVICQTDHCSQRGKVSYVPMKVATQCNKEAI